MGVRRRSRKSGGDIRECRRHWSTQCDALGILRRRTSADHSFIRGNSRNSPRSVRPGLPPTAQYTISAFGHYDVVSRRNPDPRRREEKSAPVLQEEKAHARNTQFRSARSRTSSPTARPKPLFTFLSLCLFAWAEFRYSLFAQNLAMRPKTARPAPNCYTAHAMGRFCAERDIYLAAFGE